MLRLYDTRHRLVEPLLPPGTRGLRAYASADLPGQVYADLIRRVLERSSVRVVACRSLDGDLTPLNVRPAEHVPDGMAGALRLLGGRVDLYLSDTDEAVDDAAVRHRVRSAATLDGPVPDGLDPLSVRLALMEHHYRDETTLAPDALRDAGDTIRRWRRRVAEWAELPSSPIAADRAAALTEAFDDDLDTPRALRVLRELEDDREVPPGSKFETFLHADHILALDLSIDIGRPPALS
ncbi:hypothetical protein FDA94_25245 [Herbidospora galbida]|uniref:Cysteinyl-tRNA synthetase n=1 Tax=Herbidospora galbida TaxID=2575442 RepID=A0A4U3MA30_9ACTN|nr:hypothetical protein [Herbidospora galbida]TKK85450.1 hypothetical protein FDA94_25245 [Herbidospora galbida]